MHALSTNTILHKFIFVYIPLNSNMSWYEESVMASNVGSPHMSPARRLRIVVGWGRSGNSYRPFCFFEPIRIVPRSYDRISI